MDSSAKTNTAVPVRFQGAHYMCIQGSERARYLSQAHSLWATGEASQWRDVFAVAMKSAGCAFEARDVITHV
jgi:hypothetical protein